MLISIPVIATSPLAIAFLEPVRSLYEAMYMSHIVALVFGLMQLTGGLLLFFSKTYRIGLMILFLFAFSILSAKAFYGIMGSAMIEILLILLILLADYMGHPKR